MDHQTQITPTGSKKACVTGGTGYVASILIKHLLENDYKVNTTVKDLDNEEKKSQLRKLGEHGDLTIFKADLEVEGSIDSSFSGCDYVFYVATPMYFLSNDPQKDSSPSLQAVTNVLNSCVKSKSVKRVIYTSSAATVSFNNLSGPGLVMNEDNWTDTEFLIKKLQDTWICSSQMTMANVLAEKTALEFSKKNNIDLVTVIPAHIVGNCPYSDYPSSFGLVMSLLTGNEWDIYRLKEIQEQFGSISFSHVDDVANAHLFLAETKSASGRYICCSHNTSIPKLANFLREKYPKYYVSPGIEESCSLIPKLTLSSAKIIKEGFKFKYGIDEMYDEMIQYYESKGLIKTKEEILQNRRELFADSEIDFIYNKDHQKDFQLEYGIDEMYDEDKY